MYSFVQVGIGCILSGHAMLYIAHSAALCICLLSQWRTLHIINPSSLLPYISISNLTDVDGWKMSTGDSLKSQILPLIHSYTFPSKFLSAVVVVVSKVFDREGYFSTLDCTAIVHCYYSFVGLCFLTGKLNLDERKKRKFWPLKHNIA